MTKKHQSRNALKQILKRENFDRFVLEVKDKDIAKYANSPIAIASRALLSI